jgi:hypothetical protein
MIVLPAAALAVAGQAETVVGVPAAEAGRAATAVDEIVATAAAATAAVVTAGANAGPLLLAIGCLKGIF